MESREVNGHIHIHSGTGSQEDRQGYVGCFLSYGWCDQPVEFWGFHHTVEHSTLLGVQEEEPGNVSDGLSPFAILLGSHSAIGELLTGCGSLRLRTTAYALLTRHIKGWRF